MSTKAVIRFEEGKVYKHNDKLIRVRKVTKNFVSFYEVKRQSGVKQPWYTAASSVLKRKIKVVEGIQTALFEGIGQVSSLVYV